ncbi:protein C activator [Drosophila takahashii]|uniref:protein C activator n=1 Tax=Drosophila takahashii TaxID=29030 RepID=UPI001CF851AE|nr:trypsin [Drosophila takahashii]
MKYLTLCYSITRSPRVVFHFYSYVNKVPQMWLSFLLLLQVPIFLTENFTTSDLYPEHTYSHLSSYLVSLRTRKYIHTTGDNHFCTGVILTNRHVLTSAHCITDKKGMMMNPKRIVVALCAAVFKSPESEEFLVEIQNMVIYPYYHRNKRDDIAVIKLKRTIKFDGYHLAQAVIGNSSLEVGNDCKTVGENFGIRRQRFGSFNSMLFVNVELRPFAECLDIKKGQKKSQVDNADLICVKSLEHLVCTTDFGGPLFCDGQLYGIALGAVNCSSPDPVFFSDVSFYTSWMKKIISQGVKRQPHHKWIFSLAFLVCLFGQLSPKGSKWISGLSEKEKITSLAACD